MADVFAELQGAHSPPELLAFKLRSDVDFAAPKDATKKGQP